MEGPGVRRYWGNVRYSSWTFGGLPAALVISDDSVLLTVPWRGEPVQQLHRGDGGALAVVHRARGRVLVFLDEDGRRRAGEFVPMLFVRIDEVVSACRAAGWVVDAGPSAT